MLIRYYRRIISRQFRLQVAYDKHVQSCQRPFSQTPTRWVEEELPDSESENRYRKGGNGKPRRLRSNALLFAAGLASGYVAAELYYRLNKGSGAKSQDGFTRYTISKKEDVSSTCSIFTLRPSQGSPDLQAHTSDWERAITSVQFKQPQLQIARSYTLLPRQPSHDERELHFLIRKEQNGEVSGYLHRLPIGAELQVRGPSADYMLPANVDQVIFVAGGTGIAPALQVANAVAGEAGLRILWANRKREDCVGGISSTKAKTLSSWDFSGWWSPFGLPSSDTGKANSTSTPMQEHPIVAQLNGMKNNDQAGAVIDYYVDEEGSFIRPSDVTKLIKPSPRNTALDRPSTRLIFVSGPEGFVNYWAGPKQWVNGREVQGPLGGLLADLQLQGWEVVKL